MSESGKQVSTPPRIAPMAEAPPLAEIPRPRRKRRVVFWVLLAILVGFILWVVNGDSLVPQQVRELFGVKQDRMIVDSAFSVAPRAFRYYKFSLPEGTANAAVVGQFKSVAEDAGDKSNGTDIDNGIEAYVLTESAFAVWQKGYATSSLYDSGNVIGSSVQADIPPGAGIYYLVFSNKSAPKTPKAVHATVMLHYKSWLRR